MDCMKTTPAHTSRASAGRPRTSNLTRPEQLRRAKQTQRDREASAGQTEARIKLPITLAKRLMFASRQAGFLDALKQLLDSETVEVSRYPQLKLLCWNRQNSLIAAEDAWSLYERNWRFVETDRLELVEKRLIEKLSARFGGGMPRG
jgi:hypothetical protein